MAPRMNAEETRVSFDHVVKQISQLESLTETIIHTGTGPPGIDRDVAKICRESINHLEEARGKLESMICRYDNN